jgi:uncharacterized protein YdhG (YjbR/CyaY superfamily)
MQVTRLVVGFTLAVPSVGAVELTTDDNEESIMQSSAKDVDTYIKQAPADRREALTKLRELCRKQLKGFKEEMNYGAPGYSRNGACEVAFASQKNYISLYILRQDALSSHRAALNGLSVGKGCIRYPKPEKIDFAVVKQLLVATRGSKGGIC